MPHLSIRQQIAILGNCGCREVHHCAYCRGFAQIAVNYEPDVAREGWNVLMDSDEVTVSFPNKAGQAGHAHGGPHGDQVLADVVQFACYGAVAGNAKQPPLLRHICEALIEGDKLPPFRRGQMGVGAVRVEAEGHCPDLPRHGSRFIRLHEPHGNVGFAATQRNLLPLGGERKPDIRIFGSKAREALGKQMHDQNRWRAERNPPDKPHTGSLGKAGDPVGSRLHLNGPLEHLPPDRGEAAGSRQAIHKPHVKRGLKRGKPPADGRVVHAQATGSAG